MSNTTPTIFTFQGRQVRTFTDEQGEPWFVAKDVCDVLELTNPTESLRGLDDDELTSEKLRSGGQEREMNLISESGLYTLIIRSNKPQAKPFRRWVTHDVLPAIRKNGHYHMPDTEPESDNPLITGPAPVTVGRLEEAAKGVKAAMIMARAFGFKELVARRLANEMVKEVTGIDALSLLNAPEEPEEQNGRAPLLEGPHGDDWLEKQMLHEFIEQCVSTVKTGKVAAHAVYEHFVAWFDDNNPYDMEPLSFLSFCRRFSGHFRKLKSGGRIYYIGIELQRADLEEVRS